MGLLLLHHHRSLHSPSFLRMDNTSGLHVTSKRDTCFGHSQNNLLAGFKTCLALLFISQMLWGPSQLMAQRVRSLSNSPSSQNTLPFLSHELSGNFQKVTPSGSTGNRFSGEKTRSFDKISMKTVSFYFQNKVADERNIPPLISRLQADQNDPNIKRLCQQWGVVTTVHAPDASISRVSNLKGWCLVIVGDTTTPDEEYADLASKDNVYYLSESYQRKYLIESTFVQMIPFKSFARKNIGYLFAVGHGAEIT